MKRGICRSATLALLSCLLCAPALAQQNLGLLPTDSLLGRDSPGNGQVEVITPFSGLGFNGSRQLGILDAELTCLMGLTSAADTLPYFTGSGTCALTSLTAYARTLLDDPDAATAWATLGGDERSQDAVGGILADSSSIDFTYNDTTPSITASVVPSGVTLSGDVDGAASANDLDELAVESELESVLDLADLQGDLPLGTKTSGNYVAGVADGTGIDGTCASEGCIYTPVFDVSEVETDIESAIDTLPNLTSVQGLVVTLGDAGADAFFGWDDSESAYENLTPAEAYAIISAQIDAVFLTEAEAVAAYQPLDSDLTSIASLTTTAAGRSCLTLLDNNLDQIVAWDDSAGLCKTMAVADLLTEASPANGDYLLMYGAEGDLRKVDWASLPGAASLPGDPNVDALLAWDDTAGAAEWWTVGTGLSLNVGASRLDLSSALQSWSGVTRASGFDTFAATPSSANLRSLLTDETGTGAAVFANTPTLQGNVLQHNDGNTGYEIGDLTGGSVVAYIDFHTGSTLVDYDARIIASGGTGSSGGGSLNVDAGNFQWGGNTVLTAANIATASQYRNNTSGNLSLTPAEVWSAAGVATLTSSAGSTAVNFSNGFNFTLTLSENSTLANPTNEKTGQCGYIAATASGANRTLNKSSEWKSVNISWPITINSGTTAYVFYCVRNTSNTIITGVINNPS